MLTPTRAAITPAELTDSRGKTSPRSFDQRPTWSSSYATSYVLESAENRLPAPEACFVMPSFLPAAIHVLEYSDSDAIPTAFGPWTTISTGDGSLALFGGDRPPVKITFAVASDRRCSGPMGVLGPRAFSGLPRKSSSLRERADQQPVATGASTGVGHSGSLDRRRSTAIVRRCAVASPAGSDSGST